MLRASGLRSPLAGPFDLFVHRGTAVAITGASGSGKSLLLRMLADLDPSEGDVSLDGTSRAAIPAPDWRRRVTYLAAQPGWWDDAVAAHFQSLDAARPIAKRLGLPDDVLDGPVKRLSTGERQRLALVRALLVNGPVLLLDEPTGPLDESSVAAVEDVLRERLAAGTALVVVTHDVRQATRLGARHLLMRDRRLSEP